MDIYERLGVRKAISCSGTFTILGGALMDPRVLDAMKEAARTHVLVEELQDKAGRHVAELIGVEAAFITTGAAGGLLLSTAAIIAGKDQAKMQRLPDTEGMRNEAIICKCHRFSFDHAVRAAGAKFIEIGNGQATRPWEMEAAISDRTAFGLWVAELNEDAALPFEEFRDIAHAHGLTVVVDNAAEIPPAANLRKYTELGADLVIFSGGKGIRGPQSTGLIVGSRPLIEACQANSSPNEWVIGRALKVGKEEICGFVAALDLYVNEISLREREVWEAMVAYMVEQLQDLPHVKARRFFPYRPSRDVPVVVIELLDGSPLSVSELLSRLKEKDPPIYAPAPNKGFGYAPGRGLILNPHTMADGEERIVAQRLREIFTSAA
jgi:L-seryl-tRNA(Ser) seleniumtransferase